MFDISLNDKFHRAGFEKIISLGQGRMGYFADGGELTLPEMMSHYLHSVKTKSSMLSLNSESIGQFPFAAKQVISGSIYNSSL